MKRLFLVTALAVAAAVAAGQARAADYKVFLGEQVPCGFAKIPGCPSGIPKQTTLDEFFPGKVTIAAGDTITFSSATFHSVAYGLKQPAFFLPDPAKGKYARARRRRGRPVLLRRAGEADLQRPGVRPVRAEDDLRERRRRASGGLSPQAGPNAKPATFTYTFPKAGTFKLLCTIHPGMKAHGRRQAGGQRRAADADAGLGRGAAGRQRRRGRRRRPQAAAAKPPAKTVYMGIGKDATTFGYFPNKLTVKAGTTVTFVNKSPAEPHNVMFGPKKYIDGAAEEDRSASRAGPARRTRWRRSCSTARSRRAGTRYDGTNHGNGFFAHAGDDRPAARVPLPHSSTVTFTKPGKYKFFCWIHGPDMEGEIDVTA